jgi:hypothetical protein
LALPALLIESRGAWIHLKSSPTAHLRATCSPWPQRPRSVSSRHPSSTHGAVPRSLPPLPRQDWGFSQLGRPFPEGVSLVALAETLSPSVFQISLSRAFGGLLAGAALVAAGCAWQAYMHSICPLWQQLVCWVAVGTGYFSIFQGAVDCARFAFWPQVGGAPLTRADLAAPQACGWRKAVWDLPKGGRLIRGRLAG